MSLLHNFAKQTISKARLTSHSEEEVNFWSSFQDCPFLIKSIIECIKLYCEYRTDQDRAVAIHVASKEPSLINRAFITRHVKSHLGQNYSKYGRQLEQALFEVARETSPTHLELLLTTIV